MPDESTCNGRNYTAAANGRRESMHCIAIDCVRRVSGGGYPPPWVRSLEGVVECHLALNSHLVGRDAALEEVGQLLYILQLHEGERIA